ncbi:Transposase (plasmid) [Mycetohabitans rhizoxinica HKI 454]|uniref:Transposase n=1 Tax=Mycetohabitans rhizoxinica (strain DSM 19002 / CIP 109453 / HKI 454) TaxID=882378 RepID=E5AUJ5_MYCRK|nr:Transposase [Mycetohabitans rhizoxinica HKI 454]
MRSTATKQASSATLRWVKQAVVTPFGRAMYEPNIDTFCANSSSAKRRVERAHLTLKDRLARKALIVSDVATFKGRRRAACSSTRWNYILGVFCATCLKPSISTAFLEIR